MTGTCSLPTCKEPAVLPLRAVDGIFWFCLVCAVKYRALGYRDIKGAA